LASSGASEPRASPRCRSCCQRCPAGHGCADTLAQRALVCTACHRAEDNETPHGYVPHRRKPAGYLSEQMRNFRDGRRQHDGMARLNTWTTATRLSWSAPAALAPSHRATLQHVDEQAQRAVHWVQRGDAVLGIPACSSCHGTALTGVTPNVPGLLGLPADYLVAQLGAWRQGLRHARTPDCMARIARALPADDIPDIARWLAAQPLPGNPASTSSPPAVWPLDCGSIPK
jgi:cytochrome c553